MDSGPSATSKIEENKIFKEEPFLSYILVLP